MKSPAETTEAPRTPHIDPRSLVAAIIMAAVPIGVASVTLFGVREHAAEQFVFGAVFACSVLLSLLRRPGQRPDEPRSPRRDSPTQGGPSPTPEPGTVGEIDVKVILEGIPEPMQVKMPLKLAPKKTT